MIEFFSQFARRNFLKNEARTPLRDRTAEAVLRLLGNRTRSEAAAQAENVTRMDEQAFGVEERNMVSGMLTLGERSIRSIMTPLDILEAIAGEFPDEDEQPAVELQTDGRWKVDGTADLHYLEQVLETGALVTEGAEYTSLAGFFLTRFETMPAVGQAIEMDGLRYEIAAVEDRRIATVFVSRPA